MAMRRRFDRQRTSEQLDGIEERKGAKKSSRQRGFWVALLTATGVGIAFFFVTHRVAFARTKPLRRTHTGTTATVKLESNQTIAIAGLFRNNGPAETRQMYLLLNHTASFFRHHVLVLLENDSTDGTDRELRAICDRDEHTLCITLHIKQRMEAFLSSRINSSSAGPFSQQRFSRMSFFRNIILDEVKRLDVDYVAFVDSDLLGTPWLPGYIEIFSKFWRNSLDSTAGIWGGGSHGWRPESVIESIHRANTGIKDWSAVCFYSTFGTHLNQYDMLAFRLNEHTPIPAAAKQYRPTWNWTDWNHHFSGKALNDEVVDAIDLHMGMFLFNYANETRLVPVQSCFGALTIYKAVRLQECRYSEVAQDCEHVTFHDCLRKHFPASIYIDPQSKVYYDWYSAAVDGFTI